MEPFTHDQDLINRFNQKDTDAQARIYEIYYPFVYTVVKKLAPGSSNIKDLVADCFLKLIEYNGQFKSLEKIKYFLSVATRNRCLDHLRRNKNIEWVTERFREDMLYTPELQYEQSEVIAEYRTMIFRAIQTLPRQCRQIFILFFIWGLKNAEIAAELGIAEKTVSNQKNIAKKILKITAPQLKLGAIFFFLIFSSLQSLNFYALPLSGGLFLN